MANPWDQFEAVGQRSDWDQFEAVAPEERPGIIARAAKAIGLGGREYDENEMGGQMVTPDASRRNAAEYGNREAERFKASGETSLDRDLGAIVSDTATAVGAGVKQLASAPVQLFSPDGETATRQRREIEETNAALSPQMQGQLAEFSAGIKAAAEEGRWEEVKAAFGGLTPSLVGHFTANTLPSMIPVLGAGKVAQIAAIARGAAPVGVMLAGARGAGAANAVLNAGSVRGDAFQDLEQVFIAEGMTPEAAKERALSESWLPAAVGAVTGYMGGRFGAESDILGGAVAAATKGGVLPALKAAVGSLGRELGTEQMEELLPQMTTNLLAGRDAFDGLAETSAQTVAGVAGPGAMGSMSAAQRAYDPLGSELQGLAGEIDAAQFNTAGDAQLVADTFAPNRAQVRLVDDAEIILSSIGAAANVDDAIAIAQQAIDAPINLTEINNAAQVVTPSSGVSSGIPLGSEGTARLGGSLGDGILPAPGALDTGLRADTPVGVAGNGNGAVTQHTIAAPDIRSAVQEARNKFGETATIVSQQSTETGVALTVSVPDAGTVAPVGNPSLANDPVTQGILDLEEKTFGAAPEGLAALTVTQRPSGTVEVSGPNAREIVTSLVPGESVQQRKDGSVIVGLKHAGTIQQAYANVTTPATMPVSIQQEQGNVGQQQDLVQPGQPTAAPGGNTGDVALEGVAATVLARSLGSRARLVTPGQTAVRDDVRPGEQSTSLRGATGADLGRLAEVISGRKLYLFEGVPETDGFAEDGDQQFVFVNADSTMAPASVLSHEITHTMRRDAPEAYDGFVQATGNAVDRSTNALLRFAQMYDSTAFNRAEVARLKAQGKSDIAILNALLPKSQTISDMDGLAEEFNGDLVARASEHKDTWRQVAEEMGRNDPNILRQFLKQIESLLNRLRGKQNFSHMDEFAKGPTQAEMEKNLEVIRKAAAQALARYASRSQEARDTVFQSRNPEAAARRSTAGRTRAKTTERTLEVENNVSVTVGGKPGEFGWAPSARMSAGLENETTKPEALDGAPLPPFVAPAAYKPNLTLVGESVRKVLSAKAARDVIRDVTGANITDVAQIHGSWELKAEPSFVLSGEVTFEQANEVSKLLGFLFAQDATVSTQPWFEESEDQIQAVLISQSKRMTEAQIEALHNAAGEAGLDYSTTVDGRGAKFLHFGDDAGLDVLMGAAAGIAKAAGLSDVGRFFVRSNLNEATSYLTGRGAENLRQARNQDASSGPPDLFRRSVDHLLVPYVKAVGAEGYRFSADRYGQRFGLTEAEVEYIRTAVRPKNGKLLSTVPIVSGQEKLETPRTNTRTKVPGVSKFDLAWALQNRTAKLGLIDPADRSDEAGKVIADALADEVTYALNQEGGKSAVGWYDRALHEAKNRYEKVFPELRTDPDREMLFDAVLGIASQGNDVHSNALFAGRVYYLMTRENKALGEAAKILTGTFGKQTVAIEGNLAKLEALLDRNGYDAMRRFFNTRATVGELNKILRTDETLVGADEQALKIKGAAEQTVTGWMVFGPKIGSFINNLHGDYSTLTADLWFSRTWNRVLGYAFGHSPDSESAQYVKLYRAMLDEARTGKGRDVVGMTEAEVRDLASDPRRMLAAAEDIHEKREAEYAKLRNDAVTPLRQAAKNLIENRVGTQEIPRTDTERAFQQATVERVQRQVRRKTGINLTIADIQAVLWYHEKNMYRNQFGVGDSKAEAADYADAAARFVDTFNEGDLFYVEKPTPRYIKGQKGDYLGNVKRSPATRDTAMREAINKAVDEDFTGIVARMKAAGVLTVECS